ncbi:hypothetical protein [Desulfobacula sp.]|uniref:hypothetical protein n=1 Tax=Desulfobacula sp. TaxID=2593537 RepID=UPI00262560A5|nr:hypothetical protein [Desulfobacula sp.]
MKFRNVKSLLSQVLEIADFTDNTNTTGYIDFDAPLPVGAIPLGWKATVSEGFAGDTTAVMQVGISGDLDKYSANTAQSVLAAGVVGSLALAADAVTGFSAAKTPRVTVTGGADFTSIVTAGGGSMVVELFYIDTK